MVAVGVSAANRDDGCPADRGVERGEVFGEVGTGVDHRDPAVTTDRGTFVCRCR
jgi:hypothetical protein